MAKKKEDIRTIQELAKLKFITTNLSGKEVAILVGVTEATLSKWRNEGQWDDLRDTANTQPQVLIKEWTLSIRAIVELKTKEKRAYYNDEVDQMAKLSKMIDTLRKGHTPQVYMEVMNNFLAQLSNIDLALAQKVTPYAHNFVKSKLSENKG